MSKGVLTVVSGFSGAGKGTVMKRLLEKYDDCALLSLLLPGNRVKVKWTAGIIFSGQKKK